MAHVKVVVSKGESADGRTCHGDPCRRRSAPCNFEELWALQRNKKKGGEPWWAPQVTPHLRATNGSQLDESLCIFAFTRAIQADTEELPSREGLDGGHCTKGKVAL